MIKTYIDYLHENLTPEEIEDKKRKALESHMRLYLSKDLAVVLSKMNNPIANELLNQSKKNIKFDISFLDVCDNEFDKITYIQTIKVKKMEESGLDISKARNNYNSELWTSKLRVQPTKINKVITKLYKDKYTKADIEKFGNEFKAINDNKEDKMRVVYGKEIQKWYLEENYASNRSNLGGSCMRYPEKNKFMEIYADNTPDSDAYSHVGMLILTDDNNKLLGRAIVWFNSIKPEPNRVFMDRIYTINDYDIDKFKDYAKKNNWLYKFQQTYNNNTYIDPKDNNKHTLTLSFRLKPKKYNYYPYMDTLSFFTPETGRIASVQSRNNKYKIGKIQNQDGIFKHVN